jgi:hypothetical protein
MNPAKMDRGKRLSICYRCTQHFVYRFVLTCSTAQGQQVESDDKALLAMTMGIEIA